MRCTKRLHRTLRMNKGSKAYLNFRKPWAEWYTLHSMLKAVWHAHSPTFKRILFTLNQKCYLHAANKEC